MVVVINMIHQHNGARDINIISIYRSTSIHLLFIFSFIGVFALYPMIQLTLTEPHIYVHCAYVAWFGYIGLWLLLRIIISIDFTNNK
jgi:hypothetical protein